jgi:hypothetical protein
VIRIYDKKGRYGKIYRKVEYFLGEWPGEAYGILDRKKDLDLIFKAFELSRVDYKNRYVVFDGKRAWRYGYLRIADERGTRCFICDNDIDESFSNEEALSYCEENLEEVVDLKPGIWAAGPECARVDITEELNWIAGTPSKVTIATKAPPRREMTLLEQWRSWHGTGEPIYDL